MLLTLALLVLNAWQPQLEFVRVRLLVVAAVLLAVVSAAQFRWRRPADSRTYGICGLAVLVELAVVSAPHLLGERGAFPSLFAGNALVALGAGWALAFGVSQGDEDDHSHWANSHDRVAVLSLGVATTLVLATWHSYAAHSRPIIVDELLYQLQSRLLARQGFALPIPPGTERFFALRQSFMSPRGLVPQYPPGWAWLLAAFRAIGLEMWAPAICGGITVVATATLASRVAGPATGLCAAAILAALPEFLETASFHYSHVAAGLCLVLAALAVLPADDHRARSSVEWLAFGVLVGFAALIRPVTGLTVGASIAAWSTLRAPVDPVTVGKRGLAAVAGILPSAGLFLWYQDRTTGHALMTGYVAANGALHAMGFGRRGFLSPHGTGIPQEVAQYFGWHDALVNAFYRTWDSALATTSPALAMPLFALVAARMRSVVRARPLLLFLPLPAAQAFFFWTDRRFYFELLPFIAVGLAFLMDHLGISPSGRRNLLAIILIAALAKQMEQARATLERYKPTARLYDATAAASKRCGPIVVFASDQPSGPADLPEENLEALYWFNVTQFGGPVLVARDLGPLDSVLTALAPGRLVLTAIGPPGAALRLAKSPVSASRDCLRQLETH